MPASQVAQPGDTTTGPPSADLTRARRALALTLRAAAAEALRQSDRRRLVEEQVAALRQELEDYSHTAREWRRGAASRIAIVAALAGAALAWPAIPAWAVWSTGAFLSIGAIVRLTPPRVRDAASRLAEIAEDPALVGLLAMAWCAGDVAARRVCRSALLRLLPQLTPDSRNAIGEEGIKALTRMLDWTGLDGELVRAVLAALVRIGDHRSGPTVGRLTRRLGLVEWVASTICRLEGKSIVWRHKDGPHAGEPKVVLGYSAPPGEAEDFRSRVVGIREAARNALPSIENWAQKERDRGTLLRSADPPPDTRLLRPAASSGPTDPTRLLRAVTAEPADPSACAGPTEPEEALDASVTP